MHKSVKPFFLIYATSYANFVFHTRPFSNSAESVLLAFTLTTFFAYQKRALSQLCILLGILFVLGFYTRITFLFFGFPIGLALLFLTYQKAKQTQKNLVFQLFQTIFILAISGGITFFFCALIDSLYFGNLEIFLMEEKMGLANFWAISTHMINPKSLSIRGFLSLTPINNLIYNLDSNNLMNHVLHPRFLHLMVNVPMIFGNLGLAAIFYACKAIPKWKDLAKFDFVKIVCAFSGISGLFFLSVAPHQEPRFLVPLLFPLVICVTEQVVNSHKFWFIWIIFNLIGGFGYGHFHQGGIVPTLIDLHTSLINSPLTCQGREVNLQDINLDLIFCHTPKLEEQEMEVKIVFSQTYMPPRHLFPRDNQTLSISTNPDVRVEIQDLKGASTEILLNHLTKLNPPSVNISKNKLPSNSRVILVIPGIVYNRLEEKLRTESDPGLKLIDLKHDIPHLSMEHVGEYFQRFSLNAFFLKSLLVVNTSK